MIRRATTVQPIDTLGGIRADEILPLPTLKRRLGWGNRSVSQAQRDGLRCIAYGRQKFVRGHDLLDFFGRLAEAQHPHE